MFIAIIGTPSSGKNTVANYLVERHGFQRVRILKGGGGGATAMEEEVGNGIASLDITSESSIAAGAGAGAGAKSRIDVNLSLRPQTFPSPSDCLSNITQTWHQNYVTTDIHSVEDLEVGFLKRPFFLLVGVDGPLMTRYRREGEKILKSDSTILSLESFIGNHDDLLHNPTPPPVRVNHSSDETEHLLGHGHGHRSIPSLTSIQPILEAPAPSSSTSASHSHTHLLTQSHTHLHTHSHGPAVLEPASQPSATSIPFTTTTTTTTNATSFPSSSSSSSSSLREILPYAQVNILNNFSSIPDLYSYLDEVDLVNPERLRPGWDTYFMTLASLASLRSNCMKRRVGALLVRSKRILSTGYNGTPRGLTNCNEGGCPRCNGKAKGGEALDGCLCLHAEENALLEAGRDRIGTDSVLYCNTCPCLTCSVKIVQSGVTEVVYNLDYAMDAASARVLREGGVRLRQLVMPHTMT